MRHEAILDAMKEKEHPSVRGIDGVGAEHTKKVEKLQARDEIGFCEPDQRRAP